MSIVEELTFQGGRWFESLSESFSAADSEGLVAPRSRVLCAALGALATRASVALGASEVEAEEAGLVAASLSLLSKLDDEVIDSLAFHGGPSTPRRLVVDRTRAFLAPTLAALFAGARGSAPPEPDERDRARSGFAFEVGRRIAGLASTYARRDHVLASIALGWDVQSRAACVLTAHPESVGEREVLAATRSISGAWLAMITLVGELPAGATRSLGDDEVAAIWDWGSFIQRADALCDLEKDQRDGLLSTFVGKRARAAVGPRATIADLYRAVGELGVDLACVPSDADRARLRRRLARLEPVDDLLSWIFAMLFRRYREHPLARREARLVEEGATCSGR